MGHVEEVSQMPKTKKKTRLCRCKTVSITRRSSVPRCRSTPLLRECSRTTWWIVLEPIFARVSVASFYQIWPIAARWNICWIHPQLSVVFYDAATGGTIVVEQRQETENLVTAFRECGLTVATHTNMTGVLYGKLLLNLNNVRTPSRPLSLSGCSLPYDFM